EGGKFAEPVKLTANGIICPHGGDEITTALLTFKSGFTAACTAAVFHDAGTRTIVFGEDGRIELPDPWIPQGNRQGLETSYTIYRDGRPPETVDIRTEMATYAI